MIYARVAGFLAVEWYGSYPPPSRHKLSLFLSLPVCRRSSLLTERRREWGVGGAKSYDGEKAWSSVNHSILPSYLDVLVMWEGSDDGPGLHLLIVGVLRRGLQLEHGHPGPRRLLAQGTRPSLPRIQPASRKKIFQKCHFQTSEREYAVVAESGTVV